jgi:hypothetical protein
MAKKKDNKYKVLSLPEMTWLENTINEFKNTNRKIHLITLGYGNRMYRVLDIKDNLYLLNRDSEHIIFDLENKEAKSYGSIFSNKITTNNIPWSDFIKEPKKEPVKKTTKKKTTAKSKTTTTKKTTSKKGNTK